MYLLNSCQIDHALHLTLLFKTITWSLYFINLFIESPLSIIILPLKQLFASYSYFLPIDVINL